MLKIILAYNALATEAIKDGATLGELRRLPVVRDIMQMKYECGNEDIDKLVALRRKLEESVHALNNQTA
ncbi:MAG: hypothetical protein IT368_03095 [Candidatus Hydrogenedentes bacterium]|nr:hypothetical protein [Candidatus Hydrogenedentota bacterium]